MAKFCWRALGTTSFQHVLWPAAFYDLFIWPTGLGFRAESHQVIVRKSSRISKLRQCLPPSYISLSHHHLHPHKKATHAIPCSLTCWPQCYDAPWLGCYRHKPTAADNAPDGDAPCLPDKQDAQPWGETHGHLLHPMFPSVPPPPLQESVHWPIPTVRLTDQYWLRKFSVCIVCVSASALTPLTFLPLWLTVFVSAWVLCQCILMSLSVATHWSWNKGTMFVILAIIKVLEACKTVKMCSQIAVNQC